MIGFVCIFFSVFLVWWIFWEVWMLVILFFILLIVEKVGCSNDDDFKLEVLLGNFGNKIVMEIEFDYLW
jgi:hypothetical protein